VPERDFLEEAKQLAKQGKYEAALGRFHDAGGTEGCYGEGACLYKLGRYDEAREALSHCLELDPQHEKAQQLIDRIAAAPRPQEPKRKGCLPILLTISLFGFLAALCVFVLIGVVR
jgi:tetratricopeptide (TPR) repeat protein